MPALTVSEVEIDAALALMDGAVAAATQSAGATPSSG